MQELSDLALDVARSAGAGYADIRIVERATESLTVKNGNLAEASSNRSARTRPTAARAWRRLRAWRVCAR